MEPGVTGYRVYYATAHGGEEHGMQVGNQTTAVLRGLAPSTTYSIHVTAYNIFGLESPPSDRVVLHTEPENFRIKLDELGVNLTIDGKSGESYDLLESEDLQTWRKLKTLHNLTGTCHFFRPVDVDEHPRRFYRLEPKGETFPVWMAMAGRSNPLADDNGDGISNLVTYGTGADLLSSPREARLETNLAQAWVSGELSRIVTVSYTLRENLSGVIPILECSTDLQTWEDAREFTIVLSTTSNGNGTHTVTTRLPHSPGQSPSRVCFYRLRFQLETPPAPPQSFWNWMAAWNRIDPYTDDDGYGLNNILTYASGADLTSGPRGALLSLDTAMFTVGGVRSRYRVFNYDLREHLTELTPVFQTSTDLETWHDAHDSTVEISSFSNGDGTRSIYVREAAPASGSPDPRRFYRLHFPLDIGGTTE
ncbi:MAG: fibronectin type III domain-containing protein [Akkermansiaceae bacterium]|nr:fibronectin type III domain-containing protein [Akkermansiaceae bacterium]